MRYFLVVFAIVVLWSCQSGGATEANTTGEGEPVRSAKTIYKTYCVTCHGMDGKMMFGGAADLTKSSISMDARIDIITNGQGSMASFSNILTEEEIIALAEYLDTFIEDSK